MKRKTAIHLAAWGSLAMLFGAWGFQYIGGYAPCKMCIWQRWPHGAAVLVGALAMLFPWRWLPWAGAAAALTTAGIGVYHTGVERAWWAGPDSCTGSGAGLSGLSGNDLLSLDAAAPIVMCDDVAWAMFGLSMASWNAIASLGLAALWIYAATRRISAV